ncbi:MAG: lamin tail domain-containing protein [Chloroflexota bacterium]
MFLFLLLNALVSACATLVVLILWDQAQGPLPKSLLPDALSAIRPAAHTPTPAPGQGAATPVSTPGASALSAQGSMLIESVIGVGDLETEHVKLKYNGEGEISLVGWRIEDGRGNVFIFPQSPQLTLYSGGAVSIYTRPGNNSVIELYWGMDKAIWSPGETVTLRDAQGRIQATYKIP